MKIALISDLHYGARNDNAVLLDYYKRFLDTVFFPYLKKHKISTVFIPGDLLQKRKSVNILTAKRMREDFLEPFKGCSVYVIAGNHDTYFKSTNKVNSLAELLRPYENIAVYTEPTELRLDGNKFLMLPWINAENEEDSLQAIHDTEADICIAHLA